MPQRCSFGCEPSNVPMHRFPDPFKYPDRFKKWVTLVGGKVNKEAENEYFKKKRVCDLHFSDQDRNRFNRLNNLAVPSICLRALQQPEALTEPVRRVLSSADSRLNLQPDPHIVEQPKKPSVSSLNIQDTMNSVIPITTDCDMATVNVDSAETSDVTVTAGNESSRNIPGKISDIISQPAVPVATTSHLVLREHNYYSNSSNTFTEGKITTCQKIPSSVVKKLKSNQRQMKNLQREIRRMRKRTLTYKARLENAQKMSENVAFQKITAKMTKPAKLFTKIQYKQGSKKAKGRRFSIEEKILALSIFKRSAKCYSLLARQFALPSKKTLKMLLSNVELNPGINKIVFDKIKKTITGINEDKKVCTLIFDEMSISPSIQYDAKKDQLRGFTCDGKKFADHVLVFMIKGIKANYKQPVAYYFTNSMTKTELKNIVIDVIKNIQATGLHVACTVCDQSTVNVSTINSLIEDTKSEDLRAGRDYRFAHFKVNKQVIIPLYDVPHLLKGIRNNLLTKDLVYEYENSQKIIKWEYFEKLYAADKSYGELRVAHKLTDEHINKEKIKKMKVKTAAQVFSHSVAVATEHLSARGDLPAECRDLIPLVLMLNNVFDSLNVSTFHVPNGKIYKGGVKRNSPHHELWIKAILMLRSAKFISKKNCQGKFRFIESTVPSLVNFIKTLEGVENLWKILNTRYSFDTLLTRNLNQDPVENFFGNIRSYGVRNVAPNCVAFEGASKSLLLNNFNAPHSIQANCEEDKNECLQGLDFFLTEKPSPTFPEPILYTFNEEVLSSPGEDNDKGQRSYVCGWVLRKCFRNVTKACKTCKKELQDNENNVNALIKTKEYHQRKKRLCYPNENIEKYFKEIQNITCIFLRKDVLKYDLGSNIKMICETLAIAPFTCQKHKDQLKTYFVNITTKVLIFSWCRSVNRIINGKIKYENDEDETKFAAHIYYMKHKNNKNCK